MRGWPAPRARGFTLLGVLLLVAIIGVAAAAALGAGAVLQRRTAEADLLFVGTEFRNAFKSYYESAISVPRYPVKLEDLLRDPRFPGVRRHLRKIYADPLTGSAQWGLVPAPGGGIMGVYSRSTETPIKVSQFPPEFATFEGKQSYSEWIFFYSPPSATALPGQSPGAAPTGPPAASPAVSPGPGPSPVGPMH